MRRKLFRRRWLVGACCVVLAAAGFIYYAYIRTPDPLTYFKNATQNVSENVSVGGTSYHVENSAVTGPAGAQLTPAQELRALELAYALTLARRAPLLDLEGTDPTKLRTAIQSLSTVEQKLATVQTSQSNQQLIGALYPLSFLNALADLEAAREAFIASGSDTDEQTYEAKLSAAIAAGSTDVAAFQSAYDEIGHPTYTLISGIVESSGIDRELENIADGFKSIGAAAQKRSSCIGGDVRDCNSSDITINPLPHAGSGASATASAPPVVNQVVSIFASTTYAESPYNIVQLNTSPCVGNFNVPDYFEADPGSPVLHPLFVGDMFFTKVDSGQYDSGLFHNLGVSYLLYNPITYYTCLENGEIFSRTSTTMKTAKFLGGAPVPTVLDESVESSELQTALVHATPAAQQTLLNYYLMFKDNSAEFDSVVNTIAQTEEVDLGQKAAGVPTSLDPQFLFDAKSGFYDLFLAYNPSAGSKSINIYDDSQTNPITSSLVQWSQISGSVSMQKIESDLNAYIAFHIDPQSVASALPVIPGVSQPPAGSQTYTSSAYDFFLFYPNTLTVKETAGSDNTMTVLFGSQGGQGFQIYIAPDTDSKITQQRFEEDEPSGVMNDPTNITVDGTAATEFTSTNDAMGDSTEIWFLHGGFLYEVTAPESLQSWLLQIMETWQFD